MLRQFTISRTIAATAAAVALAGAVAAVAGPHGWGHHRGGHPGPRLERLIDRLDGQLDLTPEQRSAMDAVVDTVRPELDALTREIRDSRRTVRRAGRTLPFQEDTVRTLADAHGQLVADAMVLRARTRAELLSVLSDEQRTALAERRSQWRAERLERLERRLEALRQAEVETP
ncbi:MAG: Spy/CpxP family protein refolding chaperone [Candidatus Competibacterales bacterium]